MDRYWWLVDTEEAVLDQNGAVSRIHLGTWLASERRGCSQAEMSCLLNRPELLGGLLALFGFKTACPEAEISCF